MFYDIKCKVKLITRMRFYLVCGSVPKNPKLVKDFCTIVRQNTLSNQIINFFHQVSTTGFTLFGNSLNQGSYPDTRKNGLIRVDRFQGLRIYSFNISG